MEVSNILIKFKGFQNSSAILCQLVDEIEKKYRYDFIHLATAVRVYGLEYTAILIAYNDCLNISIIIDNIRYWSNRIINKDYADAGTDAVYIEDELSELEDELECLYEKLINIIKNGFGYIFFSIDSVTEISGDIKNFHFKEEKNLEEIATYFSGLKNIFLKEIRPVEKSSFSFVKKYCINDSIN